MDTEIQLRHKLRALPVPAPSGGFAERVLAIARSVERPAWQPSVPVYALAASVALAVGLGIGSWFSRPEAAVELPVAVLAMGQQNQVRLTFTSPQAMSGVTVHLQLPEGVELVGYSGSRELRWTVDLQAGANALDLPMILKRGTGGILTTQLSHGQDRRQFEVLVRSQGV